MSLSDQFLDTLAERLAERVAEKIAVKLAQSASIQKLLYTVPEGAIVLGCSKRALESIIHERQIAVIRRGRRVYIHKRDLDEFIERSRD